MSSTSRNGPTPTGDLATGLLGAALVAPAELFMLRGAGLSALFTVVALFGGLGLAIGCSIAGANRVAQRVPDRPWARAAIMAAPSLLATIPAGLHLFDGGFASTLPGASASPFWFPLGCLGVLTLVVRSSGRVLAKAHLRLAAAVLLLAAVAATDVVNRTVKVSEHPDLHTLLLVIEVVGAGIALRLLGLTRILQTRRAFVAAVLGVASSAALAFLLAASFGVRAPEDRLAVATNGMHGRLLLRVARSMADLDGDGYSAVFGGGDCNERDASINPGAPEVEGNDVDENCDGRTQSDPKTAEVVAERKAYGEALDAWRATARVEEAVKQRQHFNVVLVAVDALRADVLENLPHNRTAFPNLFALLDESRWFTRAFAPSAGTDLSMSGLLTGRIDPFVPDATTLPEIAQGTGRATHAVLPSEVLRYVGKAILTRGLEDHDRLLNDRFEKDVGSYTTSRRTTQLGQRFLRRRADAEDARPFFLWLHYFDVHEHHEVKLSDKALADRTGGARTLAKPDKYRMLVSVVDEEIGTVVQELKAQGLWETTIVVLVSDHGEGLGEDPRLPENHGLYVYNPLVHVPVAFRIPGTTGKRVDAAISLIDVYPTLVELMGGEARAGDGVSLLPFLLDDAPPELTGHVRPLPLNETDQYGVIVWPMKLMIRPHDNLIELYDLGDDFAEQTNLAADQPASVQALQAAYAALSTVAIDRSRKGRRAREKIAKAAAEE